MVNDTISKDTEINASMVRMECISCGAEMICDFGWVNYADTLYMECQYCRTMLAIRISWWLND